MNCLFCSHGQMYPDTTTVTLTRGDYTVSINGIPAHICEQCHEYYLSEDVAGKVLAMADKASSSITKPDSSTTNQNFSQQYLCHYLYPNSSWNG
ncbi:YgiT-type zinc finger domain-containing protein [Marinobacter persicus]|uniref:YgiT-type zinc finger domain-containing protein n=1 Tax=Marinobacter persicus TaxID=930118 RepID=A0A1I3UDU0_9GAMM|nr:type II toxin-antitoxin system MqsA family antitoxin [Marinobacter persicus]GHD39847.1 hypothetical protein GCM10008110_00010 [Marinobacter persicus]SFJ81678.1 YgiT-type zinc finger domain-containing protein [Marinobacter persicus]